MRFFNGLVACLLLCCHAMAQNLVPNPGFETHSACPDYISRIHYATPWYSATGGSPDYLSECSTDMFAAVPSNQFGNQQAHEGSAYSGFYVFYDNNVPPPIPGYREYIQTPLLQPMVAGRYYNVSFYVSLSDYSRYAADAIAALFTTYPVSRGDDQVITNVHPQVRNAEGNMIDEKSGWVKIEGCFKADSAFRYITIGAFNDGSQIQFQDVGSPFAVHYSYYFIDDVSVTEVAVPMIADSVSACEGTSVTLDAGQGASSYLWNNGATSKSIQTNSGGLYSVQRIVEGCKIDDTIAVTIHQAVSFSLGNDSSIRFCDAPLIRAGVEAGVPAIYHWSNGAAARFIFITTPGTYALTITTNHGCSTSDAVTFLDACPAFLYVPNAFSPNGDGHNERFACIAEGVTSFDMKVYNRWGQIVFRTDDYKQSWNGMHNGKACESGVYVYTIEYSIGKEKRWKDGNFTLLR